MAIFPMRKRHTDLKKWDLFEEINLLNEKVNKIFDRFTSGEGLTFESSWLPALDVLENDKNFIIRLDVPGMESKNVTVQIEDDMLIMKGERESKVEEKKDNCLHMERGYGAFVRSYPLPDNVDPNNIKASCKDGVLTVELAKVPGKQKEIKDIPVQ